MHNPTDTTFTILGIKIREYGQICVHFVSYITVKNQTQICDSIFENILQKNLQETVPFLMRLSVFIQAGQKIRLKDDRLT